MNRHRIRLLLFASVALGAVPIAAEPAASDRVTIHADQANEVLFPPEKAKYVRFWIQHSSSAQPCLDELEVYGPGNDKNLALASSGSRASASSCLPGYAFHQITHLNDGRYGNEFSWIAAGVEKEWAQIALPEPVLVHRVLFSRDRDGRYADRVPESFEIRLSLDGQTWKTVRRVKGKATGTIRLGPRLSHRRSVGLFQHARFVKLVVLATAGRVEPRVDEVEIYGNDPNQNLALSEAGAKASASSAWEGAPASLVIDGRQGRAHCWRAAGRKTEWVQVELPRSLQVDRLVVASEKNEDGTDGSLTCFEVHFSLDGLLWKKVYEAGVPPLPGPTPPPRMARNGSGSTTAGVPKSSSVPQQDELGFPNLALRPAVRARASSVIPGFAKIHTIPHLNDGQYGNPNSWIGSEDPSWVEIDLGSSSWVYKVAFGSDSLGQYSDRAATDFSIQVCSDEAGGPESVSWTTVVRGQGTQPVRLRREFTFKPIQARRVRLRIAAAARGTCRIDEIEVYGQDAPIPLEKIGPVPGYPSAGPSDLRAEEVRRAFLFEEYAWLKTFGRADLDPRLIDYKRVMHYPRHVRGDALPLPPLLSEPMLDGNLDDKCWQAASRGAVQVAYPEVPDRSPLIGHTLLAGWRGKNLFFALKIDRLLSGHLAVVSAKDWRGCGIVVLSNRGLVFNSYQAKRVERRTLFELKESVPLEGAFNEALTRFEFKLPLKLFPDCRFRGLRIGLGMGGRHTRPRGRPIEFDFAPVALAEAGPSTGNQFQVRLAAASPVTIKGNLPELRQGLKLAAGQVRRISVPGPMGHLGPQFELKIQDGRNVYRLHLFHYDPLERPLALMEQMVSRAESSGMQVDAEKKQLTDLRLLQKKLGASEASAKALVRNAYFRARLAKRRLLFRMPELKPLQKILCVKRHKFEPSHNYTVILDARGGPGGSVNLIEVPWRHGYLDPSRAHVRKLFDAGKGIARTPVASYDLSRIYFGYTVAKGDYFHVMSIRPDGTGLKQLTDGPFHDYWPCPLPDGGLAFISSRCRARFLCFRPQVSVLFRMDRDGSHIQPLSYANLTEWAPSVMNDGRILWTRSEYQDKGADFGHTLWAIRPDGSFPELIFGNTIIQPNGYANGREVPGSGEICATLISHFGDLNGPIVLIDPAKGRFDPSGITSLTPEVPWPGSWPTEECFRDPVPVSRDFILCAHAPQRRFQIYLLDRFGNRELIYADPAISTMCPIPFVKKTSPPELASASEENEETGEFFMSDVYQGLGPAVKRGSVKFIRVCQEVRADLEKLPNGEYRRDHPHFQDWYATPVHKVSGPFGWPSYVAKAPLGLVRVEEDGSALFRAPAGKVLYFQALDKDLNEIQRMRSVVQLQPGETRSCIGCHNSRSAAPPRARPLALAKPAQMPRTASWGGRPFSYEKVVQPVLDARCIQCHSRSSAGGIDLTGTLDKEKVPASYRNLISRGLVHYVDCRYNPGGCEKLSPLTFGSLKSRLWKVLDAGHYGVTLSYEEMRRMKTWIDLNCPLWPDYINREKR